MHSFEYVINYLLCRLQRQTRSIAPNWIRPPLTDSVLRSFTCLSFDFSYCFLPYVPCYSFHMFFYRFLKFRRTGRTSRIEKYLNNNEYIHVFWAHFNTIIMRYVSLVIYENNWTRTRIWRKYILTTTQHSIFIYFRLSIYFRFVSVESKRFIYSLTTLLFCTLFHVIVIYFWVKILSTNCNTLNWILSRVNSTLLLVPSLQIVTIFFVGLFIWLTCNLWANA